MEAATAGATAPTAADSELMLSLYRRMRLIQRVVFFLVSAQISGGKRGVGSFRGIADTPI
jgi:hypothetical protein